MLHDPCQMKATEMHPIPSKSVALFFLDAGLIFGLLLLIYSFTYSGSFRVDDEHILIARSQSLAFWDHIQYPQVYGNDRVRHLSLISEDTASPIVAIEPGQTFLGSLLYRFASATELGGVQATFTLNLYATAITGAIIYLSACYYGFRRRIAIFSAFIFGLGTMAWPYSKTAFRDPLVSAMVALSMLGWIIQCKRLGRTQIVGFFIFIVGAIGALFFKSTALVFIISFFLSALILMRDPEQSSSFGKKRIFIGILPILLLVILSLSVSNPGPLSRFSISYYIESISKYAREMNVQTLLAVLGPFLSPSKSIFLFNPIFILIPWILFRHWREIKLIALPTMLNVFFLALFQALQLGELWAGSLVWGLRFMLPILPLFSLLLAPWLEWLASEGFHWKKVLSWGLIVLGVLVQLSGAVVAWYIPFNAWVEKGLDPYSSESIWRFKYLAVPEHLRALPQVPSWDIAWIRTFPTHMGVLIIPILTFLLLSLTAVFLWMGNSLQRLNKLRILGSLFLFALIASFPIFPSLWLLKEDPGSGGGKQEIQEVIHWAEKEAREGDLVVVDSYGTDLWKQMMNDWDRSIPWYSLPFEIPGTPEIGLDVGGEPSLAALDLFNQIGRKYSRLIYLTSQEAPDYSLRREEGWLKSNFKLADRMAYEGSTFTEAMIFLEAQ